MTRWPCNVTTIILEHTHRANSTRHREGDIINSYKTGNREDQAAK